MAFSGHKSESHTSRGQLVLYTDVDHFATMLGPPLLDYIAVCSM